jgi:HD-GYP domain-containing protein (c-di-GMP phosphodiesterase class II)
MHRLDAPNSDTHRELRQRMSALGILPWRLDAQGRVIQSPDVAGVQAAWLCSRHMVERFEAAVAGLVQGEGNTRQTLFPGCEFVLLPVRARRRISEWTAAMFLTPRLFEAEEFTTGCRRVHIDPVAAMKGLRSLAVFGDGEIDRFVRLLPTMADDLGRLDRDGTALAGFSRTLAEAYEHIELTHRLAGQMRQVAGPQQFLHDAVQGIIHATSFGWVALYLCSKPWTGAPDRPLLLHSGKFPSDLAGVRELLDSGGSSGGQGDRAEIISDERATRLVGEPDQLIVFPIHRGSQVLGAVLAGDKQGEDPQVSTFDTRVIDTVGAFVRSYYEIVCLLHEQQAMFVGSLRAITAALDAKDSYTRGHSERVAFLAAELARAVGLSDDEVEQIHLAGLMHDVGKIGVPEAVLCKAGKLTAEEFDEIKKHPRMGYEILAGIPQLADVMPGVLWHHERWDGRGYPDGIAGEAIPPIARILALADTFDAMSSNRSYRPAMPRERVLAEIVNVAGAQFDPALAERFVLLDFAEYDRLVAEHLPQRQHLAA